MALFKKTGGLKLMVGKKVDYWYVSIAITLSLVLVALAGYSMWYASATLGKLFAPSAGSAVPETHFMIETAQLNPRLQMAAQNLQIFTATTTASTTPSVTPRRP